MAYNLDDLFNSMIDIYTQYDEGEISLDEANILAFRCCAQFTIDYGTEQTSKR